MRHVNRAIRYPGSRRRVNSLRMRDNWSRQMWVLCAVVLGGVFLILFASGCAKRGPEPVEGHTNAPHVGWVIMSGDRDNPDQDFVCQSNPRSECVVPADRPDARVLSHVHVYYHPASIATKYTGSLEVGFFDKPHKFDANFTVTPGETAVNQSVTDFVSSKPGVYSLTVAVVATPVPSGAATQIRDQVAVTVK